MDENIPIPLCQSEVTSVDLSEFNEPVIEDHRLEVPVEEDSFPDKVI